ncbi:MAG TPA: glycosyltransferase family 2 protein [Pyrinomonadaceae bacterium]|nr:glycosyltransferase family 2 protein [Pyrinomonadaceae bacterium]
MRITVAIAAYNAAEYLREAIDSVLAQTFQPFEIVVVDDGSTDHTRQVCGSFGERVRYIYQENDGTAGIGARWKSIQEARGDWIALLDHDDRWLPTKLQRQIEAVEQWPDSGVIFTRYQSIDERGQPFEPSEFQASGETIRFDCHDALHHLLCSNPYCPSSALVRRSALTEDGPPSETSCGDWSDWFRITRKYPMVVVDQNLTEYRVTSEQFCSNKDYLATRMRESLMSQKAYLHGGCAACKEAFRIGEAHVKQIFSVAARTYLDQYHAAVTAGDTARALPLLKQAMRAAPMEVLRPRRFAAASKNYLRAKLKGSRKIG